MSFANNTPVQFLPGVGRRTAQVMHDLGVHTAGQLVSVPENVMVELFGPSIKTVLKDMYVPARATYNRSVHDESSKERRSFMKRLKLAAAFITVL